MIGKQVGALGKAVNGAFESFKKKKDAKALMSKAKLMQKNFQETDISVNHLANMKASDQGTKLAIESIQQSAASAVDAATEGGIRGMGMIGKIQQNTNQSAAGVAAGLSDKQSQIDVAAAQEQSNIDQRVNSRNQMKLSRADSMLERGQAMRSQASAELGESIESGATAAGKIVGGIKNKDDLWAKEEEEEEEED
jgi:hypothetical protein